MNEKRFPRQEKKWWTVVAIGLSQGLEVWCGIFSGTLND